MNINLFMAIFWMVLGAGLVIYHWLYPGENFLRLRFTDLSPGWLILVLALWNLVRWWGSWAAEKNRRIEENAVFERQRRRHPSLPVDREEVVPNPEFDFTRKDSEPPKPTSGDADTKIEDRGA